MKLSRHMPKRKAPGKTTWLGWVFLTLYAGALVYCVIALILHSVWTALGFGLFAAAIAASSVFTIMKFRRLRASRQVDDIGTFARSVPIRELDTWVIRATYEEVAVYLGTEKEPFPVRPSDRLKEDLEIDGEDLWDIVFAIVKRCGRTLDDFEKNPLYTKMKTVEDLIRVVMWQKKTEAAEPEHPCDGLPARA